MSDYPDRLASVQPKPDRTWRFFSITDGISAKKCHQLLDAQFFAQRSRFEAECAEGAAVASGSELSADCSRRVFLFCAKQSFTNSRNFSSLITGAAAFLRHRKLTMRRAYFERGGRKAPRGIFQAHISVWKNMRQHG